MPKTGVRGGLERRRTRANWGRLLLTAVFVVSAVALATANYAPWGRGAAAAPIGISPVVYVTSGQGVSAAPLSGLSAGGNTHSGLQAPSGPSGPVAINSTSTLMVVGRSNAAEEFSLPSGKYLGGLSAPGGTAFSAIAADPNNPEIFWLLSSKGNVYRVQIAGGASMTPWFSIPPTYDPNTVPPTPLYPCATSLAESPDGRSLFIGATAWVPPPPNTIYGLKTGDHVQLASLTSCPVPPASNGAFDAIYSLPTNTPPPSSTQYAWSYNPNSQLSAIIPSLVVSPLGDRLYAGVSYGPSNYLFALQLPLNGGSTAWQHGLPPYPCPVFQPQALTITGDGGTLYVGGPAAGQPYASVAIYSSAGQLQGPSCGLSVGYDPSGFGLQGLADVPGQATILASGYAPQSNDTLTYSIDPNHMSVSPPNLSGQGTGGAGLDVAITPDQAPSANFGGTLAPAGSPTSFDASSSAVKFGSVARFVWNFGDGSTAITSSPQVAHTYALPGTYTVTLTETDRSGTSVPPAIGPYPVDYPGQTALRRADPAARISRTALIVPKGHPPPTFGPTTTLPTVTTTGTPTISLDPVVGPPGTIVTVRGQGFPTNTSVQIQWSVSTGSVTASTDGAGNLCQSPLPLCSPLQLLVLVPDVLGLRSATAPSFPSVTASFLVVPGPAEPNGSRSFVFRTEGP